MRSRPNGSRTRRPTAAGFFAALGLFIGYTTGAAFLVTAALKPIFPTNVGFFVRDGIPIGFGMEVSTRPGIEVWGGYWVIPVAALIGLAILVATHRGARRFLGWWRGRIDVWRGPRELPPPASP